MNGYFSYLCIKLKYKTMIITIWIIFGILTFYLTAKNYYNDCNESLSSLDMSDNQIKNINIVMTIIVSTLYSIFGPIGLVLICSIILSKKLVSFLK